MENYYETLGVNENASMGDIKKAYRNLQMKYHPDKNPGNVEANKMTQKINEAYEILGDEQKKNEYDMRRKNPFMKGMQMGGGGMEVPMDDIFSMFFGGRGGMRGFPGGNVHIFHGGPMHFQQTLNKPPPIMSQVQIKLEQVLTGVSIPVEIERWILEGENKVHEQETIYVDIPEGIDENEMIILRDKGNVINEQCKGDVKISIRIINETSFKRKGLDLFFDKQISLKESLCGFSFELNHLNGKSYTLNNNRGSIVPPNYTKIYPGLGLKRGERKGNLVIQFMINFPDKLSDEQITEIEKIL